MAEAKKEKGGAVLLGKNLRKFIYVMILFILLQPVSDFTGAQELCQDNGEVQELTADKINNAGGMCSLDAAPVFEEINRVYRADTSGHKLQSDNKVYESEPNGSISTADYISLNDYVFGILSASYDLDDYKIYIPSSGRVLVLGVMGIYGQYFALGLYDSADRCIEWTRTKLGSDGDYYQAMDCSVSPGYYYIKVMTWSEILQRNTILGAGELYGFSARMLGSTTDTIAVSSVGLNKTSLSLSEGSSETLSANVLPSNATDKTIVWSSSDTSVASVDSSGRVTACSAGFAVITARSANGKTAYCNVSVTQVQVVESVVLDNKNLSLELGTDKLLIASIKPAQASGVSITWSSSNPLVAQVDNTGRVTAKAIGEAVVSASAEGKKDTCLVAVTQPRVAVSSLQLDKTSITMTFPSSQTLTAVVLPKMGTNKTVSWTSSNPAVASVNGNGLTTALSPGNAVITASLEGKTAECTVVVLNPSATEYEVWPEKLDQPENKQWTVVFNEEVELNSVADNVFVASDADGYNRVNGISVSQDAVNPKALLISPPGSGWDAGRDYYLFIQNLKSEQGKSLKNNTRMKFTIQAEQEELSTTQLAERFGCAVVYIEVTDSSFVSTGSGSGCLVDMDGTVITNYHVIEEASHAVVKLSNGWQYDVDHVMNYDANRDIAILKINGSGLPVLNPGDSEKLANGQKVVAIGSPLGLENTISDGLVSNSRRILDGKAYIQISVPIDHGSSGGALLDYNGNLVGITSNGVDNAQNLNFAIPINDVKGLLNIDRGLSLPLSK